MPTIVACFRGAPLTGKTLAAYVLAQALSLESLRIDLAAVSSKYIGETSRTIDAMFDAAERAGAALLIDEADALFGKRSEVSDAHDRYANIDVDYLLQRIGLTPPPRVAGGSFCASSPMGSTTRARPA